MRVLVVLLSFLLLASPVLATDYYVDAAAVDNTDTGLIGHPWKTIQWALDHMPAGTHTCYVKAGSYAEGTHLALGANQNGKVLTIQGYATTISDLSGDINITGSSTSYLLYQPAASTTPNLTFVNLRFVSTAVIATKPQLDLRGGGTLAFRLCDIGSGHVGAATNQEHGVDLGSVASPILSLDQCDVRVGGPGIRSVAGMVWGQLNLSSTVFTTGTNSNDDSVSLMTTGTIAVVNITGGTLTAKATAGAAFGIQLNNAGLVVNNLLVSNTTLSANGSNAGAVFIENGVYSRFLNCTFTTGGGATPGVKLVTLGADGGAADGVDTSVGQVEVIGCTFSGATTSHAILVGSGCNDSNFTNNNISCLSADVGLVVKGDGNKFLFNRVRQVRPFYIKGGLRTIARNNSFVATSGRCVEWEDADTLDYDPNDCRLVDNIIVQEGAAATDYLLYDSVGTDVRMFCDNNVYYRAAGPLFYVFGTERTTLANLQNLSWTTANSPAGADNDAASVIGDPLFLSTTSTSSDFLKIKFLSPARGTSSVTYADIGACQRRERVAFLDTFGAGMHMGFQFAR